MAQFQTTAPNSEAIEYPTCPKCGSPIWITRVEPDLDKRVFECPVCDISQNAVTNIK
jgi:hypothetical protein